MSATRPGRPFDTAGARAGQLGRADAAMPLISWRTKANLTLAALAVAALGCWHLAVFATAEGLGLADVGRTLRALTHGHPLSGLGQPYTGVPATPIEPGPVAATLAMFLLELVVLFGLFVAWAFTGGTRRARRHRAPGFASDPVIRAGLGEDRARAAATQTRPSLSPAARKKAPIADVGLPLGTSTSGEPVVLPLEDHVVIVAPTGAGKSRDLMIPAALSAPGPLIVTCTRADILDVIATRRAEAGQVWVFDPLNRLGWPEPMVWDPIAGARYGKTATARGLSFAAALTDHGHDSTNAGFFQRTAASAWTRLLHAADLGGRPMAEVISWALHLDDGAHEAQTIMRTSNDPCAEPLWAALLHSVATGADDTVASSRQTLQQIVEPLALREVLAWVTPRDGVPCFDPAAFVASGARARAAERTSGGDTLVLVADDNCATNVAPLCAMLLQEVIDTAKAAAKGGRLDPPIRLVGDEIANVAPLPKLPGMSTDGRGFGLQMVLAIQSLPQAERRWGAPGAKALLDNMNAEIVLGGLSDPATLDRYSDLVGQVDLHRASANYDPYTGRPTSAGEQTTEIKALRADEVRRIPDGHGLLFYRNQAPVLLAMTPWFAGPDGPKLRTEAKATEARRFTRPDAPPTAAGISTD